MWGPFKDASDKAVTIGQPVIDKNLQLVKGKINKSELNPTDVEKCRCGGMTSSCKVGLVEQLTAKFW